MKQILIILFCGLSTQLMAETLDIYIDGETIKVDLLNKTEKESLLGNYNGQVRDDLFKEWTRQTFELNDSSIIIEFYDCQGARIKNEIQFQKLKNVRFVKNYIDFLKKNISFKYSITLEQAENLKQMANKLDLRSDRPDWYNYEILELDNGNILFEIDVKGQKAAFIYKDIKTLAADPEALPNDGSDEFIEQHYKGMDEWTVSLVSGNPMLDFEPNEHLVYPKDIEELIQNHNLKFVENEIYVSEFKSNLYQSTNGYYVLIDEVKQKNGAGNRMPILTVRIYENVEQLNKAKENYQKYLQIGFNSEYFYQNISDNFGVEFPKKVDSLINNLPQLLNFNPKDLTFDEKGIAIVDEAIRWNHNNYDNFNSWFPSVLAFYGKCYNEKKEPVKWTTKFDKKSGLQVPYLVDTKEEPIFEPGEFYKVLYEWPNSIMWAGDWDGFKKGLKNKNR